MHDANFPRLPRRGLLRLLGMSAASAFVLKDGTAAQTAAAACSVNTPSVTEGPYWVDEHIFRSDIRTDPATGLARAGTPLALTITVMNSNAACTALAGAYVDIWHCDAKGIYSDEPTYNPGGGTGAVNTTGQKFLRGYQITDTNGQVNFLTIFPGWYSGRTIHIHVRVRTYNGSTELTNYTTQIFFDDTLNNTVLAASTYSRSTARDTTNATDMVYRGAQNAGTMLATTTQSGAGYQAAITIDLSATASSSTLPVIASNAVLNAASAAPGLAPGTWVSIYGTNLAGSTHALTASDLVSGYLPTNLQNTTVQIDGIAAFLDYISPSQINMLVPDGVRAGTVPVVVTNAAGTSTGNAASQSVLPGLFLQNSYVLAVRPSDGAIVNGTGSAANTGDTLEIFGTGFGTTSPAAVAGLVFTGAYRTTNAVTVTIGGVAAPVSFAGLVGAGLYQINVTVPGGPTAGDNAVIATVAGVATQSGAMLTIA